MCMYIYIIHVYINLHIHGNAICAKQTRNLRGFGVSFLIHLMLHILHRTHLHCGPSHVFSIDLKED